MEEKRKRKLLKKLINLAFKVNSLGVRKVSKTENLPTVFVNYSGHVANISFQLYRNGYTDEGNWEEKVIYTNNRFRMKDFKSIRSWLFKALMESEAKQRNKKLQESEDKYVSV